ncbi:MAG: hypothetical protein ACYTFA_04940 [Planctomycetota bacterium]
MRTEAVRSTILRMSQALLVVVFGALAEGKMAPGRCTGAFLGNAMKEARLVPPLLDGGIHVANVRALIH